MNFSLATLGSIAGLGGIAIGAVVLLLRPMIDKSGKAKPEVLGLFRLIAIGAFAIGALGVLVWGLSGSGATQVTAGSCAVAGRDQSRNTVNCAPPAKP
jgi:O-antigen/teichoic acid export membrane protein